MNTGDMAGPSRSAQRKMKLLEIEREQWLEEVEALRMTEEQQQLLSRSFRSVKVEFSDLDGYSWTKSALKHRYQEVQLNAMRLRALMTRPSHPTEPQKLTASSSAPPAFAGREVDNGGTRSSAAMGPRSTHHGPLPRSSAPHLHFMGYLSPSRFRSTPAAAKRLHVDTTPIHSEWKDYTCTADCMPHDNISVDTPPASPLDSEPPTPTPYNHPNSIHYMPEHPPGLE